MKLLYIMGIDWQWIWQRPQILAEKLSQDHEVTVLFPRNVLKIWGNRGKALQKSAESTLHFRILWLLPYQERNALIGRLAALLNRKVLNSISEYSGVFVGYPLYGRYIPQDYAGNIIYDCMDNHEALYADQKRVSRLRQQEEKLIHRCDLLLASSVFLQRKLDRTAGYAKSVLVRNGADIKYTREIEPPRRRSVYRLGYIGTLSDWFDYELIQETAAEYDWLEYHLFGPGGVKTEQERVICHGAAAHEQLGEAISDCACLIMPFRVNDVVKAVDPVKLYEYIAFGKCIISVYYEEIERFGDFVYFYRSAEEYAALLQRLRNAGFPVKYTAGQRKRFLLENSWNQRYETLRYAMAARGTEEIYEEA